jgi:hypothetical protein
MRPVVERLNISSLNDVAHLEILILKADDVSIETMPGNS